MKIFHPSIVVLSTVASCLTFVLVCSLGCGCEEGTSLNTRQRPANSCSGDLDLFDAIRANDVAMLADILEETGAPNVRNVEGATPLMLAAWKGRVKHVEMLLKAGAKVDLITANHNVTALTYAAYKGHDDIVRMLRKEGARCTLIDACYLGDVNIIKARLGRDFGAANRHVGLYGQKAIHAAVWRGHRDVVQILLNYETKVDVLSGKGRSPLGMAVELGHNKIAELLIDVGADLEMGISETPLVTAVEANNIKGAKLLLDAGAKVDATGSDWRTPLSIALFTRQWDMVELLLRQGADPSVAVMPAYTLEGSMRADQTFNEEETKRYQAILKRVKRVKRATP